MLTVHDLHVSYRGAPVLERCSAEFVEGAVHGIVGRNGAGKTTLMEALFGFIRSSSGTALFRGKPLAQNQIGYLPTENFFYSFMTGLEYLQIVAGGGPMEAAGKWAEIFEVPLDRYVDHYSAGMKKKLALLGVVMLGRPVLLLDEPMNRLDLQSNLLLGNLLRELATRGTTVLVSSHVFESLTAVSDKVHLLSGGRVERSFERHEFDSLRGSLSDVEAEARLNDLRTLLDAVPGS